MSVKIEIIILNTLWEGQEADFDEYFSYQGSDVYGLKFNKIFDVCILHTYTSDQVKLKVVSTKEKAMICCFESAYFLNK